jgi:large subunit ribosomal protein L21
MKYAIVESGGKQYRAVEGATIEVDRLPVEAGTNVKLEQVLLLADGESISVGTPVIKDTPIWTTVVEHFKGPKVNIFNYSPKKRIRVKIGHRQNYTRLLIEQIGGSEFVKKEVAKVEKEVRVKPEKTEKPVKAETKALETDAIKEKAPAVRKAVKKTETAKPAAKTPVKTAGKPSPKAKKPAATSTKKTTPAKAVTKKKTPESSPKGKKPAAK